ncbi:MAG: bifunctional 5,10-methylenetetrahydrofolate dehydrogenase/5,10-methenyltetrahydrofolate cyclohydrolase [Planctomycetes bacterium]|nr:bifunctional 5,10-methylenetetrahydrofolate dehydrogenase/5,10-methenyltetrahydrofolate cyclohydrolase [Planctomycetota bacterium]
MSEAAAGRRIDGRSIARTIYERVGEGIARLRQRGMVPHLVAVQMGHSEASDVYVRNQKERLSPLGIQFTHLALDPTLSAEALITHVEALNENPTVTGIILTMPLPDAIPAFRIQERIHPAKDVEGVHPANLGRLIHNRQAVGPCTALAVLTAIEATDVPLEGKYVVIVGHSDIVGKPVGLCLLQELATITTCHVATKDLARHTREADILVVAVGQPGLIRADMVKPGAVVIDVGISRTSDGRIAGDVDIDEVAPRASWITPVPGGIGPITVAMLARNTMLCAEKQCEGGA